MINIERVKKSTDPFRSQVERTRYDLQSRGCRLALDSIYIAMNKYSGTSIILG